MLDPTTRQPLPADVPIRRHRWRRRLRSAVLMLIVALLPLLDTIPARASTPANPAAVLTAALARQGISPADGAAGTAPLGSTTAAPSPANGTDTSTADGTQPATADESAGATDEGTSATDQGTSGTDEGTGDTGEGTGDTTESWSLSASARAFLAGLDLTFADGPLTGTLEGTTLTVAVDPPQLPLSLPGGPSLTVTDASIAIDEATGSLGLSGTVQADNGIGGSLSVTIAHSGDSDATGPGGLDVSSTIDITGVPLFGTTVDVTGTLAYADGTVSASLTGTLDDDVTVAPDAFTIAAGTTVTLSTTDGLSVDGSAVIGSGDSAFTLHVTGSVSGPSDWSLTVDGSTDTPSFTPVPGLTLTPALSGSVTDTAGSVSFDLAADDPVSWSPAADVTLAVHHVEVSNGEPGDDLHCPTSLKDGALWIDVTGELSDSATGTSATGGACIVPSTGAYVLTGTADHQFGPSDLGFDLSGATLTVAGDPTAGTSVTLGATLTLSALPHAPSFPVTVDAATDGSFTAATSVDLSQLGLGSGTGTLLLSSKEIRKYTNETVGVTDPIDLPAGVTVLMDYQPNQQVTQLLSMLHVQVPEHTQVQATLSPSGFSFDLRLTVGEGTGGARLLPGSPQGFQIYLDSLDVTVALNTTGVSLTVGGTALLHIPALYDGSSASDVDLTVNGSLGLTAEGEVSISVGFDLDAANGPWTDAFGIHGLTIGELAARIGVEVSPETVGIPLPTVSFTVNDVVLPATWADAIGEVPGASVSATLDLDLDNPLLSFEITPGAGQTAALEPLRIANDFATATHAAPLPDSVVRSLQINHAALLFAPLGGTDATHHTIAPGASLVFDATIAGKNVHVDGSIGLAPYPHLKADISMSSFTLGPITFSGASTGTDPSLAIDLEANPTAPKVDFAFSGGFTDSVSGIQFSADVDLGASIQALNAAVTLHITGGQPSYIAAGATLSGRVFTENGALAFSASGYADGYLAGKYVGEVYVSYSSDTGAVLAKLAALANSIAGYFHYIYGLSDTAVAEALNQAGLKADQIAGALQWGYNDVDTQVAAALTNAYVSARNIATALRTTFGDTDVQVADALNRAGTWVGNTAIAVQAAFSEGDTQVASALSQIGLSDDQITAGLHTAFNESEAALYNVFQRIGRSGQSALAAIDGFFHTGSFWIYSRPWYSVPLYLDDAGGSYSAGNGIIQYTWNGGHNQDWYVLPTDSGYAEIVNRLSGQCLSAFGDAGDQVVQYPCYGWTQQQWYLDIYPGQQISANSWHYVTNRATGWNLDVYGGSLAAGGKIDTWYDSTNWNQQFTFQPAIG